MLFCGRTVLHGESFKTDKNLTTRRDSIGPFVLASIAVDTYLGEDRLVGLIVRCTILLNSDGSIRRS